MTIDPYDSNFFIKRSLIEEDSDYWTIHTLSPEVWEEVREKRRQDWQWTDLM